mmetsp:Transcript_147919/g.258519  ORF Transcript_147919/g.258519 Transcript_147919/m.258519 type:complete len:82 (-) Transcript_147919:185-430(-)
MTKNNDAPTPQQSVHNHPSPLISVSFAPLPPLLPPQPGASPFGLPVAMLCTGQPAQPTAAPALALSSGMRSAGPPIFCSDP